jgi:serpin B
MKLKNKAILAILISLAVVGWSKILHAKPSSHIDTAQTQRTPTLTAAQRMAKSKLVAANTRLSFKLFSQILKQQPDDNVFISPMSIALALAMTYNGAQGETQQAMAKTLELQGMSLEDINQANASLRDTLSQLDSQVQLSLANSLWARKGEPFNPGFIAKNQTFYGAQITDLDFNDSNASAVINDWIEQSTQGKINQIVNRNDLTPNSILFLINAIYFKGKWSSEFDQSYTKEQPFTLLDGTQKQISMMFQQNQYQYYEEDLFQAVSLPYGQGRLSLYIFLPRKGVSLKTFYDQLNAENWERWMRLFQPEQLRLGLPRFKLDYGLELNSILKSLGMAIAFDEARADFTGMTPRPAYITKVQHHAFFEVNEQGSEAVGGTSVHMAVRGASPQFIVDRPFFCVIRDNETQTILFMGSIVEPQ